MATTRNNAQRPAAYVEVWWHACDDITRLLEQLPAEEWSTPDGPGAFAVTP